MKLSRLTLTNYRGFGSAVIDFDPRMTVIVGVNGAGKTSILEAIAALLSHVHGGIRRGVGVGNRLTQEEIRVGASEASAKVEATVLDDALQWTLAVTREGHKRTQTSELAALKPVIESVQAAYAAKVFELPLAVYYPTNRAVLDIPDRIRERHAFSALDAYDGALGAGWRNFRLFFEWFREQEDFENERRLRERAFRDPQLGAVRRAIEVLVPGVENLRMQRRPQRLVVDKGRMELDVSMLSDGEKCMLALVADLARRMALAAPQRLDPLTMPAVALIDEVELHLHPAWQRDIVKRLPDVFPETQFILTTHSPQVLGELHAGNVRVLRDFQVEVSPAETWGRDSNRILEALMGATSRNTGIEGLFARLSEAEDEERWRDAWVCIDALTAALGHDDPDVTRRAALLPARDVDDTASEGR